MRLSRVLNIQNEILITTSFNFILAITDYLIFGIKTCFKVTTLHYFLLIVVDVVGGKSFFLSRHNHYFSSCIALASIFTNAKTGESALLVIRSINTLIEHFVLFL